MKGREGDGEGMGGDSGRDGDSLVWVYHKW